MLKIKNRLRQIEWVKWAPNGDILVALLTLAWMTFAYYTMHHTESTLFIVCGFTLMTNLIVNVVFPTCWVVGYRKQPLSELGVTTHRWLPSLLISLLIAGFYALQLQPVLEKEDWLPRILYCALCLWEPFFIHGWLQLRFERAFGVLPGIVMAGLGLAIFHVGSTPNRFLLELFISGLIYAALFRLTGNLLALWPLGWTLASAVGTAQTGTTFTWMVVATYVVVAALQLGFIAFMGRWRAKKSGGA